MNTQTDQVRYEFTNQDTVVLRHSGMYYKAMGNSAVILKMMGATTKIRSCYDPVIKQDVFEMSLHVGKIEQTKEYLRQRSREVLRDDASFFVIRLKQPVDSKRLRREKRSEELKTDVAEDILMKRRKETPMAKEVRDISKESVILIRAFSGIDGEVLGKTILEEILALQKEVRALMREGGITREALVSVDNRVDTIQGLLLIVPDFAMHSSRLCRIGRSMNKIRAELKGLLEKKNS